MEFINQINFMLTGIARAYPILLPFITTFYALLNEKPIGFILTGLAIFDIILNYLFKSISEIIYSRNNPFPDGKCDSFWLRPVEYSPIPGSVIQYPLKKDCSIFRTCLNKFPDKYVPLDSSVCLNTAGIGMPSGHAQIATSITLVLLMILWGKNRTLAYQILGTFFLLGFAILTMINRVVINCHTILQVIVGSWIGSLLGIAYYYFVNYIYGNNPDEMVQIDTWWKHVLLWSYPIIGLIIILVMSFV